MAFAGTVCVIVSVSVVPNISLTTYLGITQTLEERCDPDKTSVVIPHDSPLLVIAPNSKGILED